MKSSLRRRLERIEVPDEHGARLRAWDVVRHAYAAREPLDRPRSLRPLLALAAAGAVVAAVAAVASPAGRAVLDSVREAIAVEPAQPTLFRLPVGGRILATSHAGPWIVRADGSKRRLGDWVDASWSPFGRFVVVSSVNELAAVETDGRVRWTIGRPGVNRPRWSGSRTDTRIAYVTRRPHGVELRVVAGDGTGDRVLDPNGAPGTPLAWRPGARHVLAYVDGDGAVRVVDVDAGDVLWSGGRRLTGPTQLEWSRDGERLLALTTRAIAVFAADGRLVGLRRLRSVADAAAFGAGHAIALVQHVGRGEVGTVVLLDGDRLQRRPRRLFMGSGYFDGVAWSPDGRWLLMSWPTADQWVFLRVEGRRRIVAVAGIARQFGGRFPQVVAWCCPP